MNANEEIKEILLSHFAKYPLMQPIDAVKLVYQNEFGGGHLIKDPSSSLAYLKKEYESIKKTDGKCIENIGNGIVRVYLNGLKPDEIGTLNEVFCESASSVKGNITSFTEKLNAIRELCREGKAPFDEKDYLSLLSEYEKAGFPMVSHSDIYRNAYKPAYRVVLASLI